jgi:hypothetical protein
MHGFINSPALAKLVALQMIDEQLQSTRGRKPRTSLRSRLAARRTARSAAPAQPRRVNATGQLAAEER